MKHLKVYENNKTHIKVFLTRSRRFRANITEERGISKKIYEVTVGGYEWDKGKGREHEIEILEKCKILLDSLTKEYENIYQKILNSQSNNYNM